MFRVEFRILILKSGLKHYELAQRMHWHPSKISSILNGVYTPSSLEKEDLAGVLGCRVEEAFPSGKKEIA